MVSRIYGSKKEKVKGVMMRTGLKEQPFQFRMTSVEIATGEV